jgi:hypothetical protein
MRAAKINQLGIVEQVIVGSAEWAIKTLGGNWVNTENKIGIGWEWSLEHGFRPPSPYPSWVWTDNAWTPPTPYPNEGNHTWDEGTLSWIPLEETNESNS